MSYFSKGKINKYYDKDVMFKLIQKYYDSTNNMKVIKCSNLTTELFLQNSFSHA